eukprot:ctg_1302.g553
MNDPVAVEAGARTLNGRSRVDVPFGSPVRLQCSEEILPKHMCTHRGTGNKRD